MTRPVEGETRTLTRTFTVADVQQFAALSGDDQPRHTEPDDTGRVMVQGLLTATLPTSIGGDDEVLAHRMDFEFVRPVYTGESITCRSTWETVTEFDDRVEFTSDVGCTNEAGEPVLRATVEGRIYRD